MSESEVHQTEIARRALDLKREASPPTHPKAERTADEGLAAIPNRDVAHDSEGQRPVLERSRKAR